MTKDEFYEKYGQVKVKFSSYYKYTFTFEGTLDAGGRIVVESGGCSDDIYKFEVVSDSEETVASVFPYAGTIYGKDNKEIESFYDY
ncbi:hypothetical protein b3_0170 [Synechococcus phage B3]|nr:hypothetical protein b3_0170 [Synechococcus phage B3]QGT54784.1 hypothetical protein b23_0169 [Synechococcus phage B23]